MTNQIPEQNPELQRPKFDSMVHMLAHAAKEHPEHTAVVSGENEISFADYYACVAGLAKNLIAMGAKGDRKSVV